MAKIKDELLEEIGNREFRHSYASEFIDIALARQIRAIRQQRKLTQAQLARLIGTSQSFISEIEDEEYGSLSISTLKDLAQAFDTFLTVRFEGFKALVEGVEHASMDDLRVPAFDDDPAFKVQLVQSPPAADVHQWHVFEGVPFAGVVRVGGSSSLLSNVESALLAPPQAA